MNEEEVVVLIKKYQDGSCTEEERIFVDQWYNTAFRKNMGTSYTESIFSENMAGLDLIHELKSADTRVAEGLIMEVTEQVLANKPRKSIPMYIRIAGVAAVMALVTTFVLLYFNPGGKLNQDFASDIKPGGNKATLTLANGRKIELSDAKTGVVIDASGLKYNDNTFVIQSGSEGSNDDLGGPKDLDPANIGMTSITTPRGGQYQVVLPDGSKVWLNAGSTLRFPSTFEGLVERRVLLIGEAYFEVATANTVFGLKKLARKVPFIVKTASQEVMVLGTHFNINCYADEKETKTTLLEGSVGITAPLQHADQTILEPGEQGVNNGLEIKVKKVNTEEAIAWKNGYFQFDDVGIQELMRQFSRWYNIEVVYEGGIPKGNFRGQLPRKMTLQKALDVLSFSEINYKLQGKKLIIKNE